jgi:hypothetical protein
MKLTPRFVIAFLTFTVGVLAAARWSAHIGRKVWSPEVFAWRNSLKRQPIIEEQINCPVRLVRARFYSFMAIGSSVGSVLKLDVKNVSDKPIHSFTISFNSPEPTDTGSIGVHPETLLQPEQFHTIGTSSNGDDTVTVSVDFVQFADGDVWFANPPRATVKPEGVRAGGRVAAKYLRKVLELNGTSAVMNVLPHIFSKLESPEFSTNEIYGYSGFSYGVIRMVASVEYARQKDGLAGVEKFLTKHY